MRVNLFQLRQQQTQKQSQHDPSSPTPTGEAGLELADPCNSAAVDCADCASPTPAAAYTVDGSDGSTSPPAVAAYLTETASGQSLNCQLSSPVKNDEESEGRSNTSSPAPYAASSASPESPFAAVASVKGPGPSKKRARSPSPSSSPADRAKESLPTAAFSEVSEGPTQRPAADASAVSTARAAADSENSTWFASAASAARDSSAVSTSSATAARKPSPVYTPSSSARQDPSGVSTTIAAGYSSFRDKPRKRRHAPAAAVDPIPSESKPSAQPSPSSSKKPRNEHHAFSSASTSSSTSASSSSSAFVSAFKTMGGGGKIGDGPPGKKKAGKMPPEGWDENYPLRRAEPYENDSYGPHSHSNDELVTVRRDDDDDENQENSNPALASSDNYYGRRNNGVNDDDDRCDAETSGQVVRRASASNVLASFEASLKKRGLEMVEQEGDGNCLFRAVSLQVYGDSGMHGEVRKRCLDFMAKDEQHFAQFVTGEPFKEYIRRKRRDGVHGNNPEIQAISELFNRPVEVFVPDNGAEPINIFHSEYKTSDAPIRLSYHDGNHYNAVIDPLCPTAGLGLGLPGLEPGLADRLQVQKAVEESDKLADQMQLKKAVEESHDVAVNTAIKESKMSVDHMYKQKALALSDLEATDFELEQAVLASSLESYQNNEQGRKQPWLNRDRRRQGNASPPGSQRNFVSLEGGSSSSSAALPAENYRSSVAASSSSAAVAAPAAASAAAGGSGVASTFDDESVPPQLLGSGDEYPRVVEELVMNGFELSKVLHAYELIGENFDDLLAFLVSSGS